MTKANGQMSKEIYLAGGCFWGAEHFLKQIEGVEATEVGYANGHTDRPTYEEVCTDKTGFAETVRVVDEADAATIDQVLADQQRAVGEPLAVEHLPLRNFYPAEDYHQDYLEKNPAGYCHLPAALFELARKAKPVPSDH